MPVIVRRVVRRLACSAAIAAAAGCNVQSSNPADRDEDGVVTEREQAFYDADWYDVGRYLVRPTGGLDPDARGRISMGLREDSRRFRFFCDGLDPGSTVDLFVEDAGGTLAPWKTVTAGPAGRVRERVRARSFESLPGGADSLNDLKGRAAEVRTPLGAVLLQGTIAHFSDRGRNRGARSSSEGPGPGVVLRTRLSALDVAGRQIVSVRVEGLAPFAAAEVRIEDGAQALQSVAAPMADALGRATVRWDGRRGDPLPFDETSAAALSGRAVEVRVGGVVVGAGSFPDLP